MGIMRIFRRLSLAGAIAFALPAKTAEGLIVERRPTQNLQTIHIRAAFNQAMLLRRNIIWRPVQNLPAIIVEEPPPSLTQIFLEARYPLADALTNHAMNNLDVVEGVIGAIDYQAKKLSWAVNYMTRNDPKTLQILNAFNAILSDSNNAAPEHFKTVLADPDLDPERKKNLMMGYMWGMIRFYLQSPAPTNHEKIHDNICTTFEIAPDSDQAFLLGLLITDSVDLYPYYQPRILSTLVTNDSLSMDERTAQTEGYAHALLNAYRIGHPQNRRLLRDHLRKDLRLFEGSSFLFYTHHLHMLSDGLHETVTGKHLTIDEMTISETSYKYPNDILWKPFAPPAFKGPILAPAQIVAPAAK